MDSDKILERIRGLINKAESLENSGDPLQAKEAVAYRERADDLMQKYAVEEWQTLKLAPKPKPPTRVRIVIGDSDNAFGTEAATLVNIVAKFAKCSSIWIHSGMPGGEDYCWVYGYESDLRYFELLFTNLYLHFGGSIFPKPDVTKTLGENAYELHNAGMNWFDIAKVYGWYQVFPQAHEPANMYVNRNTNERATWSRAIGSIKKAYTAEVKRRGEQPLRVPPNGSMNFRRNAAQGYLNRIGQRLNEIAGKRGTGTELVLADKSQNIKAAMESDYPNASRFNTKQTSYNADAYRRGVNHANTANLNPAAGQAPRPAIS